MRRNILICNRECNYARVTFVLKMRERHEKDFIGLTD